MVHVHSGASNSFFPCILLGLSPLVLVKLHWYKSGITQDLMVSEKISTIYSVPRQLVCALFWYFHAEW